LISGFWETDAALQHDMRTTPTTAMTLSFAKRVSLVQKDSCAVLIRAVCVSDALVAEIKRIVKESEILK
jgi:hypothetical protein